jgi:hypothetical protein
MDQISREFWADTLPADDRVLQLEIKDGDCDGMGVL